MAAEASPQASGSARSGAARPRRWWLRIGVPVVLVAGALFAVVRFGPEILARYLASTYFQGLNIDTSGVDTLDIDLFSGRVAFGPVTFRGSESEGEAGQIGRLGLKIDHTALFRKRASLASVIIEGIRLDVRQAADGELSFNGIPLRQILAEKKEQTAEQQEQEVATDVERDEKGWGVGLDDLELRDSRLVFTDRKGGEATIEVEQLDLEGFRTWTAESPGTLRLKGGFNGIGITAEGTATPLSNNVRIDSRIEVKGITVPRIEAYTGPLGFGPSAGTIDLNLASKGSALFPDGKVDGVLDAQVAIREVDVARTDVGLVKLAKGDVTLPALHLSYDGAGAIGLNGTAKLALDATEVRLADGMRVAAASLRADLQELSAELPEKGDVAVRARPDLAVEALELGGPHIAGSIGLTRIELSAFSFDPVQVAMMATGSVGVKALDLAIPLRKPIGIKAASFDGRLGGTELAFGDRTAVRGPIAATVDAVAVAVAMKEPQAQQPTPSLRITGKRLNTEMSEFALDDGADGTTLKIGGPSTALDAFALTTPVAPGYGLDIRADRLTLGTPQLSLSDAATLSLKASASVASPELILAYVEDQPVPTGAEPPILIMLKTLGFDIKTLAYGENGPEMVLNLAGPLSAERLDVAVAAAAGSPQSAIRAVALDLDLADAGYEERPPEVGWHAKLDLGIRQLDGEVDRGREASARISDLRLDGLDANSRPAIAFERFNLGRLEARVTHTKAAAGRAAAADKAAARSGAARAKDEKKARPWPPPGTPEMRIGQIALLNGGKVTFVDETTRPPARGVLDIRTLALLNLDSTRPRQRSDLKVDASLDGGAITIDGWAELFRPRPDFSLTGKIQRLKLASLSPYLGPELGLDLIDGTLDADSRARAESARLDGEVKMTIRDAAFADRPGADDAIARSIGLPLNTVIDLLEDPDGTIDLVIPFEGDLLSPDFDLSQVFWTGFVRVLRALVTAPFKLVSASVSLLSASEGKGAAAGGASPFTIDPIVFQPGSAVPDPSTTARIRSVVQVMKDRPRLRLKICGVASGADVPGAVAPRPAGEAAPPLPPERASALVRLVNERMDVIARSLTTDGGIGSDRLQRCPQPGVNPADTGPPRVELRF